MIVAAIVLAVLAAIAWKFSDAKDTYNRWMR